MDNLEEVDPVSGNPVPPGAEPEEVRDDIDAKLSEGEFVIPANVVKFIGVEKIMSMVKKAEEGLAQLEEAGMTGKPAAEDDDVELPFDESELEFGEEEELGFAEGGLVQGDQVGNLGLRKYQDRLGFIRYVPYTPEGKAAEEQAPKPKSTQQLTEQNVKQVEGDNSKSGKADPDPTYNIAELSDDDLLKGFNQQKQITSFLSSPAGKIASRALGVVPGVGAVASLAALAQSPIQKAFQTELEKRGIGYQDEDTKAFDDNYYGQEIGNSGQTMGDRFSGQSSVKGSSGAMSTQGVAPKDFKGSLPDLGNNNPTKNKPEKPSREGNSGGDRDSGFNDPGTSGSSAASPGGLY